MSLYDPQKAEKKWQAKWDKQNLYKTNFNDSKHPKYYNLVMFPYPSGDKLHIGHWYSYAPADSWGRYKRMKGYNVFEPMGFDSFGLPAENYAIKHGVHPAKSTKKNIDYMRKQLSKMGTMYDWNQEVQTSSPDYYKWTQWLFIQLYKNDLAYKKKSPVNWCPKCKTVLANEQVHEGACERCNAEVTKKDLNQWFFNIRKYAERLLDFKGLDWPENTKLMQEHWIGKSTGSEINFEFVDPETKEKTGKSVKVFTTRIDTLFGCTYMVLAPEHELVKNITTKEHKENVNDYIKKARKESDIERTAEGREKTGVETGAYAINPVNNEVVPVWIADYVLASYGTGAVMAVPAHDERDYEFAKKYKLPIKPVVCNTIYCNKKLDKHENEKTTIYWLKNSKDEKSIEFYTQRMHDFMNETKSAYTLDGLLINSDKFNGLESAKARKEITKMLKKEEKGDFKIQYKLRDWLISRQRFWGAPIPIINCDKCGEMPVPEKDLPVKLPMMKGIDYKPKGKSPLATVKSFINTKCPNCGKKAQREADTMDTFVCSSWYFLRYPSANNDKKAFDKKRTNKWLPVDMYIGGPEHACMHLLYARFINKVMKDLGYIDFEEPFKKLVHQGLITKNGAKMSKSKGNVVSPDEFVEKYGSDIFRMYLMFMGPFSEGGDWNDSGIKGIARFVDKFFDLIYTDAKVEDKKELKVSLNKTIKKISEDIEDLQFNTCVSSLMEFTNTATKTRIDKVSKKAAVKLIAPFAPHLAEELWEWLGEKQSVFNSKWPKYDEAYLVEDNIELVIQVNGKVRAKIDAPADIEKKDAIETAKNLDNVKKYLKEGSIVKEIYVPGRLVNIVVK